MPDDREHRDDALRLAEEAVERERVKNRLADHGRRLTTVEGATARIEDSLLVVHRGLDRIEAKEEKREAVERERASAALELQEAVEKQAKAFSEQTEAVNAQVERQNQKRQFSKTFKVTLIAGLVGMIGALFEVASALQALAAHHP